MACAIGAVRRLDSRIVWLEGTLDSVPNPITVTDLNMRWILVNKVTEGLLGRTRHEIKGRHCSEWKADICGTDKCGIASLRRDIPQTTYIQNMPDGTQRCMAVDTSYILDRGGRRIGHVEMVTDIHAKHQLEGMHANLAAALEEMTASVTELDAQTKSNAANATAASSKANATRQSVATGTGEMEHLRKAMEEIYATSARIVKITKVIEEIAFQTNILALNAAVEAARAGKDGLGFAVVAEEVRNLASRVTQAAKETADLMAASSTTVNESKQLVTDASTSLSGVLDSAAKIDELLEEIARSSTEQAQGISALVQALAHIERQAFGHTTETQAGRLVQILNR